ncbi:MAG: hypothetical protein M3Y82_13625 [Verrucomicrobiota bacterium]|nr:hypothetical protein [Verrucomicrobiota bacterium]
MVASFVYVVLHMLLRGGDVFGALPRMFLYQEEHPFQYIALVTMIYGFIATFCALRWSDIVRWQRHCMSFAIMITTIIVASVPGGVLWKIHDMQAGYFPTGIQFWSDLFWGASSGLQIGWLLIALSLPYNLIGLIAGHLITLYGFRITAQSRRGVLKKP